MSSTPGHRDGRPDQSLTPAPSLVVFDVNGTLSDMAPLQQRFEEVGTAAHEATTWFASLLRDGFALTVTGNNPSFASMAAESLRVALTSRVPTDRLEGSVEHVLAGLSELEVHPDVAEGVTAMRDHGLRMVTLSQGASGIADTLLTRAGIRDSFEHLLSVHDAGTWKPAAAAYQHALGTCGVSAAQSMLVAVHPWDLDGAHRAGLRTAWINRSGARYPAYFAAPDMEAASVSELAQRLTAAMGS
ncbi:MAG: haloacid dehalogenase type II [Nocardioides sp.]